MTHDYLFVFGTLKRGQYAHHLLSESLYIGLVETQPIYKLWHVTTYPAMTLVDPNVPGDSILGELYHIPKTLFARLDHYEGLDRKINQRAHIKLKGLIPLASGYLYTQPTDELQPAGTVWPTV